MRILVTGAAGFIGSHLVEGLLADGHRVTAADNLSGGVNNISHLRGQIDFVIGDLLDQVVREAAMDGVEVVLHQAAIPSVPASISDPIKTHMNGSHLTALLLESARQAGVRRFVQASTCAVYGDGPTEERSQLAPKSPYAAEKAAAEDMARAYADCYEMDACSLRYFNVYGPRQNAAYAGVITRISDSVRLGDKMTVFGDGSSVRDYVFVSDVVRANVMAATCRERLAGGCFNVGTGLGTTVLELIKAAEAASGKKVHYDHGERRHEILASVASTATTSRVLGFSSAVGLKDWLSRLLGQ